MSVENSLNAPSSRGIVAQAEELYESYLNARLQRAERTLQSIKMSLARDPVNRSLTIQMREATKEIEALRAQISEQSVRTEMAKLRAVESPTGEGEATSVPDAEFRRNQAAAAVAAMEAHAREMATEAAKKAESDAAFNAAQAERAKKALEATRRDKWTCPKCRGALTPNGNCLSCGYTVPAGPGADFISKEEIDALRRPSANR